MTLRRALLLGHRWVGLVLGLLMVLLGITGSLLVFQREIDAALNPALFRASGPPDPALGYAEVLRIAQEASGQPVGQLRAPDAVWPVWVATDRRGPRRAAGFHATHIDPATGRVLGRRDVTQGFTHTIRQLHEALLMRDAGGRDIVGWAGVVLFLFCVTGIWLWWPRGRAWRDALVRVRRRPALLLNLDLHRVAGIWISVVMAVVAFSGVAIVFPQWFRPLLGVAAPERPAEGRAPPRREAFTVDADEAVRLAQAAIGPGQVVTTLQPPGGAVPRWTVTFRPAGSDPELRNRSAIALNPWSGAVLEERSPRTRNWGEEFLAWQRWLHGGALLGWPGRALVFLSGLALPLLFGTGAAAWLLRRRARRRLPAPIALKETAMRLALPLAVLLLPAAASAAPALPPPDLSAWALVARADAVVKAVLAILLLCSVLSWTVALAKALELRAARRGTRAALAALSGARSLAEAQATLAASPGPCATMARTALEEAVRRGDPAGVKERAGWALERLVAEGGRRMARGTGVLATIGATAPFVGLFGTVWGIMNSFLGIARSQTTNLAVVAPGIAEALLATAIGLVAAIPAVVLYNACTRGIAAHRAQLAEAAAGTMRLLSRELEAGGTGHLRLVAE